MKRTLISLDIQLHIKIFLHECSYNTCHENHTSYSSPINLKFLPAASIQFYIYFQVFKKIWNKNLKQCVPIKTKSWIKRLFALEDNSEELNPLKRQLAVIYDGDTFMTVELFATYFTTGQIPVICQVHKTHSGYSIAHIQRRILYFQASQVVWCLDL